MKNSYYVSTPPSQTKLMMVYNHLFYTFNEEEEDSALKFEKGKEIQYRRHVLLSSLLPLHLLPVCAVYQGKLISIVTLNREIVVVRIIELPILNMIL